MLKTGGAQISQQLCYVFIRNSLRSLNFNDQKALNQQIGKVIA